MGTLENMQDRENIRSIGHAEMLAGLASDRAKAHLFARVPKMGWVYLAVSVIVVCAFAAVVLMRMP